jgi:hypothetical protein
MKRNIFVASLSVLLCAAGIPAHTQTSSAAGAQRGGGGRGPITVTGCLERGDSATTAGAATSTADAPGMSGFMLSHVRMSGSATSSPPSPPTSETSGGTATGSTAGGTMRNGPGFLTLQGDAEQLRPHVGHQVEITGKVAGGRGRNNGGAATDPTADSGTTGEPGNGRRMRNGAGTRTLQVESVKMIASSCAEK